jgi:hypothetical protein
MGSIDDPIEAVKRQYPEEPRGPVSTMLDVLGPFDQYLGLVNVFRQFRSQAETNARVKAMFDAFEFYIREHEHRIEELEIEKQLEDPNAQETVITAVRETLLTADHRKIQRFGTVLGHEFLASEDEKNWEDAAAYIRDLAELGEEDIKVLSYLYEFQSEFFRGDKLIDYNLIFRNYGQLLGNIEKCGFRKDDFYARCSKLSGFGLVLPLERRNDVVSPSDFAFRLTGMGKHLVDILREAGQVGTAAKPAS